MVAVSNTHLVIRIVTPCGGSPADVDITLESVERVVNQLPELAVRLYRVFNNGLPASDAQSEKWSFDLVDLDINPAASTALARNAALDYISEESFGSAVDADYLLFLDAGDTLLPDLLNEVIVGRVSGDIIIGSSLIRSQRGEFRSIRLPLYFKHIINPIYLGSAVTRTQLALTQRFVDGRKEDWKYWLALLGNEPRITKHHSLNYAYTIAGLGDHALRKSAIIDKQYAFYRDHLQFSAVKSVMMLCFHYLALVLLWWVVQPVVQVFRDDRYRWR